MNKDTLINNALHYSAVIISAGLAYFTVFFILLSLEVEADRALHWSLFASLITALATLFFKMVVAPLRTRDHDRE
ncbi:hypothetical protein C6Y40_01440 [Alteromonas alba]|uniref:Uncharacterized protein n=1 Tax=Alteromonas alba TaxID=2079529 RepID=A0A2S9VGC9_9ALTE|nr:hypothetical protein [Alteromonas alba]PRO75375.1 hypothetical protein C6Y40_01440 [Alteromonas alba]